MKHIIPVITLLMLFNFNFLNEETINNMSKNSCIVKVNYSSGSPASGVKVGYEVGGGISCIGGGTAGYSDPNGQVVVEWSEGCKCTYIYIDGKAYKGEYKNGGSYQFTK